MGYAGSFNGFPFGTGLRPGLSVATLSGWRGTKADVPLVEGQNTIAAGPARRLAKSPRIGFNLHAETPEQLETLIDGVEAAFCETNVPLPLTIADWSMWVQVIDCDPVTAPEWPGPERTTSATVQFRAADTVLYGAQQTYSFGSPSGVASVAFEVANPGRYVPNPRRAIEVSLTAHGTTTNPRIRIDHPGGEFEQITFQGLTMGNGQVLTIGADRQPRVNGIIRGGYTRSLTERGVTSRAPRWWRLLASTGVDGRNEVTIACATGALSGTFKTRGTK